MKYNKSLRIVHITENLGWGGVNSFIYDLCREQKKEGMDVEIIGIIEHPDGESEINETLRKEGIRITNFRANGKRGALLKALPLHKYLRKLCEEYDLVCNLHLKVGVLVGVLATLFLPGVRCVETYHNMYSKYWLQLKLCSPFIKKYICVSETARNEMIKRFKIPENKLVTITNGVAVKDIQKKYYSFLQTKKTNEVQMVSIGRLSKEKDFIVPVTAYRDICSDKCVYIIGGDGPERENIEIARKNNPYITLQGRLCRDDVLKTLASSDILVMSSKWEGRSILLMESMAFGLPMILSDINSFCEMMGENHLQENETFKKCSWGYLVKQDSIEGYKMALSDFLVDVESRKKMRERVLELGVGNDISITAHKYLEVYQSAREK